MKSRKTPIQSWYFDMNILGRYWNVDGQPRFYHHTGAVSGLFALREALAEFAAVDLETTWARHQKCADMLQQGLADMGLEMYVSNKVVFFLCII
jgi:alanine-glyoxylate transaminase/serine-glyoxylate transaminase/serine-pyruvate transaminase